MDQSLAKQIKKARARIKMLKEVTPELFPQWQRLQQATAQLKAAEREYKAARRAWEKL